MAERERALENAGSHAGTRTKRIGKRRKNPMATGPSWTTMKPASFSPTKSTNQLMEETMHQMGQIMKTSGGLATSSSLARAAAAIPSAERTPIISNVQQQQRTTYRSLSSSEAGIPRIPEIGRHGNSFAALGNDSDNDSDNASEPKTNRAVPTIRFAPAAFSLGQASSSLFSTAMLPTKTPPTTPNSHRGLPRNHHHKTATGLLGSTLPEEDIEELHYQQRTGLGGGAFAMTASRLRHGLHSLEEEEVADDEDL